MNFCVYYLFCGYSTSLHGLSTSISSNLANFGSMVISSWSFGPGPSFIQKSSIACAIVLRNSTSMSIVSQYDTTTEPAVIAPTKSGWRNWDAQTWATVVSAICTAVAIAISLWFGVRSMNLGEESLRQTSDSIRQANLATIYALGGELTKFDQENTELAKFFDKELRRPWITKQEFWQQFESLSKDKQTEELCQEYKKLWEEFSQLDDKKDKTAEANKGRQIVVYMACQRIGDFTQLAFIQRNIIPDNDWNSWWSYITDQYDESPFYRAFLAKRPTWYAFHNAIKPENRGKFYRPPQ
jgi:hypothetical protein